MRPRSSKSFATNKELVLSSIADDEYVAKVLPETHELWGARRDFERYAADFRATAATASARRPFTVGLRVGNRIVCSCKRYDRELRWQKKRLRASGIGAVFTSLELRGRGYASAMLGALLDEERAAGRDLAFLFSDIHPAFYERLGFIRVPSRLISLRAASLDGSHSGARPLGAQDWAGMRRCFDALDLRRPWSLKRTPLFWARMRQMWSAPAAPHTQPVQLVIRDNRHVVAYVLGRRALTEDAFVIDDFAFNDEGYVRIGPLLRAAAGDLARITGWLPPAIARDALPGGAVRPRRTAIAMVLPLTNAARAWWRAFGDEMRGARADPFWSADHV